MEVDWLIQACNIPTNHRPKFSMQNRCAPRHSHIRDRLYCRLTSLEKEAIYFQHKALVSRIHDTAGWLIDLLPKLKMTG